MCIRVAATSTVNLNISSANLETLTESILSWRTQIDLEKKAVKKIQVCFLFLTNLIMFKSFLYKILFALKRKCHIRNLVNI